MSGNAVLTLGGGVYNFCELDISGKGSLAIAAGVESEIFIDSPDDPGSGCANNTGNVDLSGQSAVNPSQNPLSMQLYVYGLNNGKGTVKSAVRATSTRSFTRRTPTCSSAARGRGRVRSPAGR